MESIINKIVILSSQRWKTDASFTSSDKQRQKINIYMVVAVSIFQGVFVLKPGGARFFHTAGVRSCGFSLLWVCSFSISVFNSCTVFILSVGFISVHFLIMVSNIFVGTDRAEESSFNKMPRA